MERLTRRIDGVVVYVGTKNPYTTGQIPCEVDSAGVREMMYRLVAYEDTGLYPESVEALKLSMMGKAISEITEFDGLPIDRLRELADADKDGRVGCSAGRAGGRAMGLYDVNCDCVRADERFICRCVRCGQERLKKNSVCVMVRKPHETVKTLCYVCVKCYVAMLDELGVGE